MPAGYTPVDSDSGLVGVVRHRNDAVALWSLAALLGHESPLPVAFRREFSLTRVGRHKP